MNRMLLAGLAFASLTLSLNTARAQRRGDDAASFGWESNYQSALDEAARTGKPLMLVFRCVP